MSNNWARLLWKLFSKFGAGLCRQRRIWTFYDRSQLEIIPSSQKYLMIYSIKCHWIAKVKIRNIFAEVCVSVLQNLRLSEKRYIRLSAGWWSNILHPCLDFVEHSVAPHSEKMSPEQDLMEFRDWIVSQENWNPVSFDSHKTLSKADWIPLHNLLWFSLPPLV